MFKITSHVVVALLLASTVALGQPSDDAPDYTKSYRAAIAAYYDVAVEDVNAAAKAGIVEDELPVAFYIAASAEVSSMSLVQMRKAGTSWHEIGSANGLDAGDFYVRLDGEPSVPAFKKTLGRFKGAKRHEFHRIKLKDQDVVNLVNLRLMYRHYGYSQHLIMNLIGDGKTFPEAHAIVEKAATGMRDAKMAEGE